MRRSSWVWVGAIYGVVSGLSACGDDDGATDGGSTTDRDARVERDSSTPDSGGGGSGGGGPPIGEGVWTHLGYDVRSNYFNPAETAITVENAATLELKWSFEVAGYPTGSVAVANGRVYALATGGLYAIDLADGSELWRRTDLSGQSSVTYHDGHIYVHTMAANLYKVDAQTGDTVWGPVKTYEHPGADGTSSPVVAAGKVMVGHSTTAEIINVMQAEARGGVFAADIETGEEAWHYYTVELPDENGAMVWSTVSVDEEAGMVFASTGNNYTIGGAHSDAIHAIDLETGERQWVTQVREGDIWVLFGGGGGLDTDFGANPIIADVGGQKLVAAGDKGSAFWALDRVTGEILWSREDLSSSHNPQNGGVLNNGAFDGERFYVVSNQPPGRAVLHALDPADGSAAWEPKTLNKTSWGMPTVANGVLFVPSNDDLLIYAAATGEQLVDGRVIVKSGLSYPLDRTAVNNNQIHCYGLPD
jgi:outer membrane protein assembly factor BamB